MDWKFEEGRIYSLSETGELMAEATYEVLANGDLNIDHTYVNPSLRGRGIADEMMRVVAEYLRREGCKAVASCSYAHIWFERNQEMYGDILSGNQEDVDVACKIGGPH